MHQTFATEMPKITVFVHRSDRELMVMRATYDGRLSLEISCGDVSHEVIDAYIAAQNGAVDRRCHN